MDRLSPRQEKRRIGFARSTSSMSSTRLLQGYPQRLPSRASVVGWTELCGQPSRSDTFSAVTADEKQWANAAARLSGTCSIDPSGNATLRMEVDQTEIVIERLGEAERSFGFGNQGRLTRLSARLTSLGEVELHVERRPRFGAVLSHLPGGGIQTGDIAFDRAYRVTGAPRLLVQEILDHACILPIAEHMHPAVAARSRSPGDLGRE